MSPHKPQLFVDDPPFFFLISQTKWKSHDRSSSALLSVYKHTSTQVNCFLLPSCYNRGSIWFFNHPLVHCALAPVSSTFSRTLHYYYYPFSSVSSISPLNWVFLIGIYMSPILFTNALLHFTKPPLACFTNRR